MHTITFESSIIPRGILIYVIYPVNQFYLYLEKEVISILNHELTDEKNNMFKLARITLDTAHASQLHPSHTYLLKITAAILTTNPTTLTIPRDRVSQERWEAYNWCKLRPALGPVGLYTFPNVSILMRGIWRLHASNNFKY